MKRKNLLLTACLAVLASGNVMAADATWTATTVNGVLTDQYFPMIANGNINLNAWYTGEDGGKNAFDDATKTITFKSYWNNTGSTTINYEGGMVGWEVYDKVTNGDWSRTNNVDFTSYTYLVVQLNKCPGVARGLEYIINDETNHDPEYGMQLGSDLSNHCSVKTKEFTSGSNTYQMTKVMRVMLRDNNMNTSTTKNDATCFEQLQLSNVFLTSTLPDWDHPVKKTPSANYGTICLPYNATVAGAYIYQITGKSSDGKSIYITPYNGLLKAGVPYIYKALTSGATVNFYQIESGAEATATKNNGLVGMYTGSAAQGTDKYVIYKDQLYLVDSNVTLTNGAYIDLNSISEGSAKGFSIELGDGTTGISDINKDNTTSKDNAIYTITGVKVSNDQQRGIYIKNGKKYIKNN